MHTGRDLAITLRSIAYEERHRIVTALTEEHGLVSAVARNAIQSRRFGGALEPFAAAEWHFTARPGADLWRLDQAQTRRAFEGLRGDFERLALASAFNELLLKVAPRHEPCGDLFRLHSNALAYLDELPKPTAAIEPKAADLPLLNAYFAKVLQWAGAQPRLESCLECGSPLETLALGASLACVAPDAGWLCPDCRARSSRHLGQLPLRVSAEALIDLRLLLALPIRHAAAAAKAPREAHRELFAFLEALFAYHIPGFDRVDPQERPLKSLRFLNLDQAPSSRPPEATPQ